MEHPSSHHWAPIMNQLMTHCVSFISPPTHHTFPGLRKYASRKGQSWAQGTKMSLGQYICTYHIYKASQMLLVIKNVPANARDTRDTWGVWQPIWSTSSQSPAWLSRTRKHQIHMRPPDFFIQWVENSPAMQKTQETQVRFLGWEDPLEEGMATHSSILAWKIPWTETPGRLQSMGSQRVRHDWATEHTST